MNLGTKTLIRFEGGEYFGPLIIDAICHHVLENKFTYSLVKDGEIQPTFWFDSDEVITYD